MTRPATVKIGSPRSVVGAGMITLSSSTDLMSRLSSDGEEGNRYINSCRRNTKGYLSTRVLISLWDSLMFGRVHGNTKGYSSTTRRPTYTVMATLALFLKCALRRRPPAATCQAISIIPLYKYPGTRVL